MAFNMNKPIIMGTTTHKAAVKVSVAKATNKSIVAPVGTTADRTLLAAAAAHGKSTVPGAIDYNIKTTKLDWGEREEKDPKTKKLKTTPRLKLKKLKVKTKGPDLEKRVPPGYQMSREEQEKLIKLDPKQARQLPTSKQKVKLQKATATAATRKGTDRFEKAAKKFGYDLSTAEGYEEALVAMEYLESTDEWINPKGTYDPSGKESSKVSKTPEEIAEEKENERLAAEATQKLVEEEETRQAQVAAKREAELLEKQNIKAAEKEAKRVAVEEQNIAIRARNEEIRGAKELYGKATKSTIEKYRAAKLAQEQELTAEQTEIYEEDDPEFGEAGYDAAIHGGVEEQEAERKRRLLDTATSIESRGAEQLPTSPPTDVQQPVEMPSYEMPKSEPMIIKGEPVSKGRVRKLDKLWKNSQEGGTIRENLRNEGYVPPSER